MPDHRGPDRDPTPKKLLFIHSGSPKKRLTFEVASALDTHAFLFNPAPNWAVDYARECCFTHGLSLGEVLAMAARLHERVHLDGAITFWEEDVPTCALIAERLGLRGNSPAAALRARSKYQMRQALRQGGVPVPPFALVDGPEDLLAACAQVGMPAVLKPEWGADSEWVCRVESPGQALEVFADIRHRVRVQDCIYPYPTGRFVLEGYLAGPEVSVEGVVQNGRATLYAVIDKAEMAEPSFIERGERTPSHLPAAIQDDIRDMVLRGVRALGLGNSGIHAEVRITPSGPRIVEIGARMGGDCIHGLVKRVYGIDLAAENIRVALGVPVRPAAPAEGWGLSQTLVPDCPGRVSFDPARRLRRSPNLIEIVLTKHSGDEVLVPPEGYDNLAWVSVWGKNYRAARKSLNGYLDQVGNAFVIQPDGLAARDELPAVAGV